jgi:hypothetical protein
MRKFLVTATIEVTVEAEDEHQAIEEAMDDMCWSNANYEAEEQDDA